MRHCPACGAEVKDNGKFCPACGIKLDQVIRVPQKPKKNKFSSKKILIIALVIVIIAIVGVVALGMISMGSDDGVASVSNDTNSSNSVEEVTYVENSNEYWASENAEKFHLPSCEWAKKISPSNKIVYHTRQAAIDAGKVPCGACNP